MAIVYGFLFGRMHPWLFERCIPGWWAASQPRPRQRPRARVLYVVFFAVLAGCNLMFDYARVRAVVEDRHSMLGAIAAAARFIESHYAATVWLFAADVLLLAAVLAASALVAPGRERRCGSAWRWVSSTWWRGCGSS